MERSWIEGLRVCCIVSALCVLYPTSAGAQARECASLLRFGIYDYIREHSLASSSSAARQAVCESRDETRIDRVEGGGGADVNVFGIVRVAGEGSGADEHVRILRRAMCGDSALSETDLQTFATDIRLVNPDVMMAYRDCLRLSRDGLHVTTDVREDFLNVTIGIRYTGGARAQVNRVVLEPANAFTCAGDLASITRSRSVAGEMIAMSCARRYEATPNGIVAPAATIAIHTSSEVVVRHFASIEPRPTRVADAPPIGAVVAYAGPLELIPVGWIPCDGRVLPASRFRELASTIGARYGGDPVRGTFAVPDLRGRFVRGLNGAVAGEGRDPEGVARQLGGLQLDATRMPRRPFSVPVSGAHTHWSATQDQAGESDTVHESTDHSVGELDIRNPTWLSGGEHGHSVVGGDPETRPPNVALIYIIHAGTPR